MKPSESMSIEGLCLQLTTHCRRVQPTDSPKFVLAEFGYGSSQLPNLLAILKRALIVPFIKLPQIEVQLVPIYYVGTTPSGYNE